MENTSQLKELCYILSQRNEINNRRTRAKDKRHYYNNAAIEVDSFNSGGVLHSKPKQKWLKVGATYLRAQALKAEQEYVKCKLETCNFTTKHHRRVIKICSEINARLCWNNGYVHGVYVSRREYLNREKIQQMGVEYQLDLEMDRILSTSPESK